MFWNYLNLLASNTSVILLLVVYFWSLQLKKWFKKCNICMNIVYHSVITLRWKIGFSIVPFSSFIIIILFLPFLPLSLSSSFPSLFSILPLQDFRMISLDLQVLTGQWHISQVFSSNISIIGTINSKEINVSQWIFKFSLLHKETDIDKDKTVKKTEHYFNNLGYLLALSYDFQNISVKTGKFGMWSLDRGCSSLRVRIW